METLQDLRERLLAQQFLFDDPAAYRAGVYDAFEAVRVATGRHEVARGGPRVADHADEAEELGVG